MSGNDDLPHGWCLATIEAVCQPDRPISYGVLQPGLDCPDGVPLVRVCDVVDGRVAIDQLKRIAPAISANYVRTVLRGGEVLLTVVGTIGRTAVVPEALKGANTARAVAVLPVSAAVEAKFVELILRDTRMRAILTKAAHEVARKTLNLEDVRKSKIPLAPLAEQRRIVAKIEELFSDLDAGVAALERAKANLKRYRASVLKAAVEGQLTAAWRAEHPATEPTSQLLERILAERRRKWEADQLARFAAAGKEPPKGWREKYVEPAASETVELPALPEGWCWASVDQVAEFTRYGSSAKTTQEDSGVPVLRMGNIVSGAIDFSVLKFLPSGHLEFPDLILKKGDLLFNRTNSAELVGKSAVYEGQRDPCSYASYLIAVRCWTCCNPRFLCYYINSTHGRRWVKSVVSQQVGQANVNGTKLQSLVFPLPPVAEQEQIVADVAEKMSQIDAAAAEIDRSLLRAARLRQSILKQAFAGKLVPQDPNDEPASVLLERIRESQSNDKVGEKGGSTARTRGNAKGWRRMKVVPHQEGDE